MSDYRPQAFWESLVPDCCTHQQRAYGVGKGLAHVCCTKTKAAVPVSSNLYLHVDVKTRRVSSIQHYVATEHLGRGQQQLDPDSLQRLASAKGVTVDSLRRLGVARAVDLGEAGPDDLPAAWMFGATKWNGQVWSLHEYSADGDRLRYAHHPDGGLLIPSPLTNPVPPPPPPGMDDRHRLHYNTRTRLDGLLRTWWRLPRLVVCEGVFDTAALLDAGSAAVGRLSCEGGLKLLVEFAATQEPGEIVVVTSCGEPRRTAAEQLAAILNAICPVRLLVLPPGISGLRAWQRSGIDLAAAIDATARHPRISWDDAYWSLGANANTVPS